MSLAPIDIDCIDINLLTDEEINLLNDYHNRVYYELSSYLEGDIKEWLKEATKKLER